MSRFKVGQKVVCVKVDNIDQFGIKHNAPKKGEIVTCVGYSPDKKGYIYIREYLENWSFNEKYFAPLQDDGSHLALVATVEQEALEELKLEEIEVN